MNITFWNIGGKDVSAQIKDLVSRYRSDILILIESQFAPMDILSLLNETTNAFFYAPCFICKKIQIFTRFSTTLLQPIYEERRHTARRLILPTLQKEILFIAVHFQSKTNWSNASQSAHSYELKRFIEKSEELVGHDRTIVLGDFNMNPFDYGMVQTTGIHSTMDKNIAQEKVRIVDGNEYNFFYNPMWSFYGENGKGKVNGTFYARKAEPVCYFWNIIDQVIIRPSILELFNENSLEIITATPNFNFINSNGKVNKNFSDHLPVTFNLKHV